MTREDSHIVCEHTVYIVSRLQCMQKQSRPKQAKSDISCVKGKYQVYICKIRGKARPVSFYEHENVPFRRPYWYPRSVKPRNQIKISCA